MPDNAHDLIDERLEAMEREITEIYTRTEAEIEKTADEYFRKFKKLDDQKRRQVEAGKLSEEEYLEWKKNKVLYSKRFTEMKQHCAEQILNVNQTAVAYVNGKLPEMYALGYNDLKTAVDGIGGYTFTLISPDTVKRLITDNRSLLPLKKMNPAKDIPWNMKNINAEVLQGILQGESMDKIARRIRNVQEMNRASAIRTARTAVTGAENKGRQDSYIRAERDGIIMEREWLATKDHRTRDAHAELDGQLRETDEPFENSLGEIMYPGDPNAHPSNVYNCRCTLNAKVLGFRKKNSSDSLTLESENDIIFTEFNDGNAVNDFFYYDDEKRGLIARKNSAYNNWEKGLSTSQKNALYDYTGSGYESINDYLRKANGWESINAEIVKDKIKQIDSAISSFDLKQNIVVQRGVTKNALDDLIANYGDDINSFIGKTYHDDAFMSSTVLIGNPVATSKPVVLNISIPAGKGRGAYINKFGSQFQDTEYEFLIKRGSAYTITDISEDADLGKIYIKMVMNVE